MKKMSKCNVGVWSLIDSFSVLTMLLESDVDFVVFDYEHGLWQRNQLVTASRICKSVKKYSVARIPNPTQEWIQLVHDSYSDVVQIAGIKSQSDIDKVSLLTEYPPSGTLGFSPWTFQGLQEGNRNDYFPKICLQFEDLRLVQSFIQNKLILSSNINSIFIGRYDLSISMGCPGEIDNPKLLRLIELVKLKADEQGIFLGTVSNSIADSLILRNIGVDFISIGSDVLRLSEKSQTKENKWI